MRRKWCGTKGKGRGGKVGDCGNYEDVCGDEIIKEEKGRRGVQGEEGKTLGGEQQLKRTGRGMGGEERSSWNGEEEIMR